MTKGEELVARYLKGGMNTQEVLEFRQQARDFFQSDAPQEEKEKLRGYMESVVMVCRAIEEGRLKDSDLKSKKSLERKKEDNLRPLKIPKFLKKKIVESTDKEGRNDLAIVKSSGE